MIFAGRRIGNDIVRLCPIRDHVLAHLQIVRDDPRHRLDRVGIDLLQLLDPVEDARQLLFEPLGFIVCAMMSLAPYRLKYYWKRIIGEVE